MREQWIYHQAGDGPGASGDDTPIARRLDENADGIFDSTQFFLADRQGSVMAIVSAVRHVNAPPNQPPDRPGAIIAKVRYSAYGEPTYRHPLDFDGDGVVGGPVEIGEDYQALLGVLASYGSLNNPYRSGWGNLANASGQRLAGNVVDPATEIQYFQQNYPAFERNLQEEFGNLPLYAGYWWDPQLKLYHVRHRVYDPFRGRWLQRDPIGYAGGPNLYQYVGGLPYEATDPLGLWAWDNDWVETMVDLLSPGAQGDAARSGAAQGASDGLTLIADSTAQIATVGGRVNWIDGASELHTQANQLRSDNGWTYQAATGAGYVANGAALLASGVLLWDIAGGGMMEVQFGRTATGNFHTVFGAGGRTVHAYGARGAMKVTEKGATRVLTQTIFNLRGIPVLSEAAVTTTGVTSRNCVTAAAQGFFYGWFP